MELWIHREKTGSERRIATWLRAISAGQCHVSRHVDIIDDEVQGGISVDEIDSARVTAGETTVVPRYPRLEVDAEGDILAANHITRRINAVAHSSYPCGLAEKLLADKQGMRSSICNFTQGDLAVAVQHSVNRYAVSIDATTLLTIREN